MPSEPETTRAYTRISLSDVEDVAVPNGFGHRWEARVAREPLGAQETGLTYFLLRPGQRSPFAHRHREAEEIYVILQGTGRIKLGDEILEVQPRDAIRVSPEVARAFEAGADGLEFLAIGRHHPADGEPVDDPWVN
jgi:mannose-6-phosphate isomerase-like protein (cupin superfamily)